MYCRAISSGLALPAHFVGKMVSVDNAPEKKIENEKFEYSRGLGLITWLTRRPQVFKMFPVLSKAQACF